MKNAIIAGLGEMPIEAAKSMKARGDELLVITFMEHSKADFEGIADEVVTFSIGQVGKILKKLKDAKPEGLLFIGKFNKSILEKNLKLDLKALWMLAKLKDRQENTIMYALVDEVEKLGIKVLSQLDILSHLAIKEGVYSKRKPNKALMKDVAFAYEKARGVAGLDMGQAIVVKNKTVMAMETIEGTNATIARGSEFSGTGFTVVKVAKPDQDYRFDLPVIGMETLREFASRGGALFAVEADLTLIVNLPECIDFANKSGFILMAYKPKAS